MPIVRSRNCHIFLTYVIAPKLITAKNIFSFHQKTEVFQIQIVIFPEKCIFSFLPDTKTTLEIDSLGEFQTPLRWSSGTENL